MPQARPKIPFNVDDDLAWEEHAPIKHEYLAGEIFAMVGATDAHVTITLNLATLLRAYPRGKPWRSGGAVKLGV